MDPEAPGPDTMNPVQSDPVEASSGTAEQSTAHQAVLPQPNITTGGSTTVTASPDGAQIDGSTDPAAYGLVSYRVATGAMSATTEFTVNPASGAAFEFMLIGTGSGYSSRFLRLFRVAGSNVLQAATTAGVIDCGPLPSGQPTAITLAFDGASKTFDVLIGGAASACTGEPTKAAGPVNGFRMQDSPEQGFGGHVAFSSLALLY
jgi:hypothetical protein